MPPITPPSSNPPQAQFQPPQMQVPQKSVDTDHLLPPHHKKSAGPMIGTVIVVIMLILGALYFWGEKLNKEAQQYQAPLIPNGTVTVTVTQ